MIQANEDELGARHNQLDSGTKVGDDLIEAGNFGSDKIADRITDINGQWTNLMELSSYRKKRLLEAVDFYQVCVLHWCRGEADIMFLSLSMLVLLPTSTLATYKFISII